VFGWFADLEIGDTAGLETCATLYFGGLGVAEAD